ncbi:hypothetical protein Q1695_014674 [Nippostrongylus brasiliensis]|nr:hypothetical protein Q1695_014674 [Nippostrongylus brasiliensis]
MPCGGEDLQNDGCREFPFDCWDASEDENDKPHDFQFLRFEASTSIFEVPFQILLDSKVIMRLCEDSTLLNTDGSPDSPLMDLTPIRVPFSSEEFNDFLVAMTMLRTNNDLLFLSSPASLCSILKVADYFECPTLIRRVLATINDKLVGESPSDICEAFNILSDRTAEQRSQMEHENVWNFNC